MNIVKSMSGKLLCLFSHHELVTRTRPCMSVKDWFIEERRCSRCGFSFMTGKLIHNTTLQRNRA